MPSGLLRSRSGCGLRPLCSPVQTRPGCGPRSLLAGARPLREPSPRLRGAPALPLRGWGPLESCRRVRRRSSKRSNRRESNRRRLQSLRLPLPLRSNRARRQLVQHRGPRRARVAPLRRECHREHRARQTAPRGVSICAWSADRPTRGVRRSRHRDAPSRADREPRPCRVSSRACVCAKRRSSWQAALRGSG